MEQRPIVWVPIVSVQRTQPVLPASAIATVVLQKIQDYVVGLLQNLVLFSQWFLAWITPRLHLRTNYMRQSKTNEFFLWPGWPIRNFAVHMKKRLGTFLLSQHPATTLNCQSWVEVLHAVCYKLCTARAHLAAKNIGAKLKHLIWHRENPLLWNNWCHFMYEGCPWFFSHNHNFVKRTDHHS